MKNHLPYFGLNNLMPRRGWLLLGLFLLLTSPAFATIRYVNASVVGGAANGSSWANAYGTLQPAIDASSAEDEVWVARGTYKPTTSDSDNGLYFVMKEGVKIYGGFTSGQMNINDRDSNPATNGTVLSGDVDNDNTLAGNSYHVIFNDRNDLTAAAVLDGFTVTGGNAGDSSGSNSYGGGMYNDSSSPTLNNCSFQGNEGGGMYNYGNNSTLTNCSFQGNSATNNGGGMYNTAGSSPTLTNCSFQGNSAETGGAMYNRESNPVLTDCSFQGNYAQSNTGSGAGMYNLDSSPSLINCSFQGNTATFKGGGMYSTSGSLTLTNCSFQGNIAHNDAGGGMYNEGVSPTLTNCSFQGNRANTEGGGMYNRSDSPTLTNCSFQNNLAAAGAAIFDRDSSPTLTNCVLFGNRGQDAIENINGGTVTATYSLFEASETDYIDGGNNLTTTISPFASTTSTELRPGSPAIDAGLTSANTTTTDLAGNSRVVGSSIDMGAYEFQCTPIDVAVSGNTSVTLGYGDNCTTLMASASGGSAPYGYVWKSGNTTLGTNDSQQLCPTATTTYTVTATDANGCAGSTQVTVTVQDVSCGPNGQNVTICYYGVTQCVSEKIARRYLKLGATLGACGSNARQGVEEAASAPLRLSLKAFPNPLQDVLTLEVLAPKAGPATFEVLDLTGRTRQTRSENLVEGLNEIEFRLGTLNTGVYLIRAVDVLGRQGVVKVSKQ